MRSRRLPFVAIAALTATVTVLACGGDDNPPASVIGRDGGGDGGGRPEVIDTGIDRNLGPQQCEGNLQLGELVKEIGVQGDPPPPLGGTVMPGTYVLTSMYTYVAQVPFEAGVEIEGGPEFDGGIDDEPGGPQPTGRQARGTLSVVTDLMRFSVSRGTDPLPPDTSSSFQFKIENESLAVNDLCPTPGTRKIAYSAVGGALTLYVDATHREVYTRYEGPVSDE